MPNDRIGFAPYWLTWAIREDEEGMRIAEDFVNQIPPHFVSRLFVINRHTKDEYGAGDRYMVALTYLASIWSITELRFEIVCGYKDDPRQEVDTSVLDHAKPTAGFLHAQSIGEEAWRKERERRGAMILSSSTCHNTEPEGRWMWVEDDTDVRYH
jgi:hypothetical protein